MHAFIGTWFFLCLTSFLLSPSIGHSQMSDGRIEALVQDEAGTVLSGATVKLFNVTTRQLVLQTIVDENGFVQFTVDTGKYRICVASLGYLEQCSDTLAIGQGSHQVVKRSFLLKSAMKVLEDVVIVAKRPTIQIDGNKLILNTENSLSAGTSAMELLKTMPGVSTGQDDEILFRGAPGVQVTINGKMTYLSGKELAEMLNGLNTADVAKIELLALPSANFDATGTGGVINIVTKKPQEKGYAVELRSTVSKGRYWMVNDNLTGSYKADKLQVDASLDYNTPHKNTISTSSHTISKGGNDILLERTNEVSFKIKFYTYKIGAAWQLAPGHQLTANYHGYTDDFTAPKTSSIVMRDRSGKPVESVYSTINIIEPYYFDAFNAGYQFDIDTSGKKLTADVQLISYRNYSNSEMESRRYSETSNPEGGLDILRSNQPGFIRVSAYKVDALLPYSWLDLKVGLKYAVASNDNTARFDSLQNGQYVEALSLSNDFKYRETISAAYLSASKVWRRTTFNVGLRLEHTDARSWSKLSSGSNQWNYTRLFPSLSINTEINDDNRVDFSLSRRIERPPYAALNPVRWYNDPYYMFAGNANLQPETSWLYGITYTWKRQYFVLLNYSLRSNYLSRNMVKDLHSEALISQRANFDHFKRLDLSVATTPSLSSWWKVQWSGGINLTTYPVDHNPQADNLSQSAGNLQCINQLKLPGDVNMELAGYWYSRELFGIFQKGGYFYVNAGLAKSFFDKRLGLRIALNDVFFTNNFRAHSLAAITDYRYFDKPDTRRAMFSLSYSLGGKLQSVKERRTEEQDRL
jgi:outer membrane receptor protein involved in Fe transport